VTVAEEEFSWEELGPTLKIFDASGHSTDVISRAYLSPEPKKHRHTTLAHSLTVTPYPCD